MFFANFAGFSVAAIETPFPILPGFIEKNNGELILGTECDQRIFSKGEQYSNTLISPNYPFAYPPATECKYYLYGLHDKFIVQNIKIQFEKFDLPNNNTNELSSR